MRERSQVQALLRRLTSSGSDGQPLGRAPFETACRAPGSSDRSRAAAAAVRERRSALLVDRIRSRLAEGRPLTGSVTRAGATEAERQAAARLLGRRVGREASRSVWLPGLEETLRRARLAPDLAAAVTVVAGPIANRPAAQAAEAAGWDAAFAPMAEAAGARPALIPWAERVRWLAE